MLVKKFQTGTNAKTLIYIPDISNYIDVELLNHCFKNYSIYIIKIDFESDFKLIKIKHKFEDNFNIQKAVDDIEQLITILINEAKFYIYAYGSGGIFAYAYLAKYSHRVEKTYIDNWGITFKPQQVKYLLDKLNYHDVNLTAKKKALIYHNLKSTILLNFLHKNKLKSNALILVRCADEFNLLNTQRLIKKYFPQASFISDYQHMQHLTYLDVSEHSLANICLLKRYGITYYDFYQDKLIAWYDNQYNFVSNLKGFFIVKLINIFARGWIRKIIIKRFSKI